MTCGRRVHRTVRPLWPATLAAGHLCSTKRQDSWPILLPRASATDHPNAARSATKRANPACGPSSRRSRRCSCSTSTTTRSGVAGSATRDAACRWQGRGTSQHGRAQAVAAVRSDQGDIGGVNAAAGPVVRGGGVADDGGRRLSRSPIEMTATRCQKNLYFVCPQYYPQYRAILLRFT